MESSVRYSRDLVEDLSLETLPHVSAHSSTSLALAIDSINIVARYFDLQVRYSMIQPCFRDCKHVVVRDNGILNLNKVSCILERTYIKMRDFDVVVVLATCRALFSRLIRAWIYFNVVY